MVTSNYAEASYENFFKTDPGYYSMQSDNYATKGLFKDLNGDGVEDAVTLSKEADTVSLLEGSADGSFAEGQVFAVGTESSSLVVADLTGDGVEDAVTLSDKDDEVTITKGSVSGFSGSAMTQSLTASSIDDSAANKFRTVSVDDIDGDGDNDFIVAAVNTVSDEVSFAVFQQFRLSSGTFKWLADYKLPVTTDGPCVGVALSDLTGDGDPDFIVQTSSEVVIAFGATGTTFADSTGATFSSSSIYDVITGLTSVDSTDTGFPYVVDIDSDGDNDLIISNGIQIKIYYNTGEWSSFAYYSLSATSPENTGYEVHSSSTNDFYISSGDVDGDGSQEVMLSTGQETRFFSIDSKGDLMYDSTLTVDGLSTSQSTLKDLNNDGKADIATFSSINPSSEYYYEYYDSSTHSVPGPLVTRLSSPYVPDIGSGDSSSTTTPATTGTTTETVSSTEREPTSSVDTSGSSIETLDSTSTQVVETATSETPLCDRSGSLYSVRKSASHTASKRIGGKSMFLKGPKSGLVIKGGKPSFVVQSRGNVSLARRIRTATFYLDGKKLETVDSPVFGLKLVTKGLKAAVGRGAEHTVKVKVKPQQGKSVTFKLNFYLNECEPSTFKAKVSGVSAKGKGNTGLSLSSSTGSSGISNLVFDLAKQLRIKIRKGKTVGKVKFTSDEGSVTESLKIDKNVKGSAKTLTLLDSDGVKVAVKLAKKGGKLTIEGLPVGTTDVKVSFSKSSKFASVRNYCSKAKFKTKLTPSSSEGKPLSLSSTPKHSCTKKKNKK